MGRLLPVAMSTPILLQRIRFPALQPLSPSADPYFGAGFDAAAWQGQVWQGYWRAGSGAAFAPDGIRLARGAVLSSDTYFNAFFAAYWRRQTTLRTLSLRLDLKGRFLVQIFRHTERGEAELLHAAKTAPGQEEFAHEITANGAIPDGLRFSFSLTALEDQAALCGGGWHPADVPAAPVRITVAITTYNRPEFVEKNVRALVDDPALAAEGVRVLLVDQSDEDKLGHLQSDRCRVLRQLNLGGAGGFGRAMYEAAFAEAAFAGTEEATHLLLMDDDLQAETDSVLRVLRMAQFASGPAVLGGTMFDLYRPHVLVGQGEFFDRTEQGFHVYRQYLPNTEVDRPGALNAVAVPSSGGYCAWWFCLIPVAAIRQVGLPVPFFVRGDDIQYSFRLLAAGYPSSTVPGTGVWHVPFYSKGVPWVQWIEKYNLTVLNALIGPVELSCRFRQFVGEALMLVDRQQFRLAAAWVTALEEFVGGWDYFRARTFPAHMQQVRAELAAYPDEGAPDPRQWTPEQKQRVAALRPRLEKIVARFNAEGAAIQRGFAAKIPSAYSVEAWKPYLATGTLAHLPGA